MTRVGIELLGQLKRRHCPQGRWGIAAAVMIKYAMHGLQRVMTLMLMVTIGPKINLVIMLIIMTAVVA